MPLALAEHAAAPPEPDRVLSAREFRAFQIDRPDHEHWELIAGRPVMMSPAFIVHNRIAGNLERLLNDALAVHDPTRIAVQRIGVELGGDDAYRPEPDFAVIDANFEAKQRFVDRVHRSSPAPTTSRSPAPASRGSRSSATSISPTHPAGPC